MRIILIATLIALIAGGIYLAVRGEDVNVVQVPSGGEGVIAFGDSLVRGTGASSGKDFPSLLENRIGVSITNAGRPGDTTGSALTRLEQDVLSKKPRIVIVLLGGNDALRKVTREETFKNLEEIVFKIKNSGAAVLLLGIKAGLLRDEYRDEFNRLAEDLQVNYIPDILDGIFGNPELMYDYIHPNDQGYEKIANRIEPLLRVLLVK